MSDQIEITLVEEKATPKEISDIVMSVDLMVNVPTSPELTGDNALLQDGFQAGYSESFPFENLLQLCIYEHLHLRNKRLRVDIFIRRHSFENAGCYRECLWWTGCLMGDMKIGKQGIKSEGDFVLVEGQLIH